MTIDSEDVIWAFSLVNIEVSIRGDHSWYLMAMPCHSSAGILKLVETGLPGFNAKLTPGEDLTWTTSPAMMLDALDAVSAKIDLKPGVTFIEPLDDMLAMPPLGVRTVAQLAQLMADDLSPFIHQLRPWSPPILTADLALMSLARDGTRDRGSNTSSPRSSRPTRGFAVWI